MRTRALYSPEIREFLKQRKLLQPPPEKSFPKPLQASHHYRFCEDMLFPGTWRVEPVGYMGVGVVYLFRGQDARKDAIAFSNRKNWAADKRKEVTRK